MQDAAELLAWPHLRARDYFAPIELAGAPGRAFEAPTPPWRYAGTPHGARRVSPALGQHSAEVRAEWQPRRPAAVTGDPDRGPAPLAGLRVVDMTWVWAGPFAGMQFAHLGADVVKLETSSRVDVTRRLGPFADGEVDIDRSGYFNQYNQGKRSVVLDVKQAAGLALLKQIVANADLIIDNMRPGSLARMGLDMGTLRALNPHIVAVAMSGFGEDGPERDRMAYGSIIDALSGVAASNGAPGRGPTDFPMSLPDPAAGIHAAIAATAALYRVRCGGPGERRRGVHAGGHAVRVPVAGAHRGERRWSRRLRRQPRRGDEPARHLPLRRRRPVGGDRGGRRRRLRPPGCGDQPARPGRRPRASPRSRRAAPTSTSSRTSSVGGRPCAREEVVAALREAGVAAEAVHTIDEVATSAPLSARGFLVRTPHRKLGVRPLPGPAWTASRSPMCAATAAPCFGEHTREVLAEIVGLSDPELDALDAQGLLR